MEPTNPLEMAVAGYVAIYNEGPDGFAVGGYSRKSKSASQRRDVAPGTPAVTNIKRARWIARTFHEWDVASEEELYTRRMNGGLTA